MLTVDKDATAGGQLLGLDISFEDPQGKKFTGSADFSMRVRTLTGEEELRQYWYVAAIAAIILLVIIVRALKGKNPAASK